LFGETSGTSVADNRELLLFVSEKKTARRAYNVNPLMI
jgi:hypothetical protein